MTFYHLEFNRGCVELQIPIQRSSQSMVLPCGIKKQSVVHIARNMCVGKVR